MDSISLLQKVEDYIKGKIEEVILHQNPWIKLFNSSAYGCGVMEISRQKATWSAYQVNDIKSPSRSEKRLLYQCEVPRDQAMLNILKG
ncbi:hypothetical protein SAMN06264849_10848 [Melghirimyces algeriensis]|uniref:Uncharacterized protein n=2 Tax=Melghirimyces algeriensis TaxID=910412 RepID=A0A521E8J6_9BACL|nr:hypothetical protein SAMN06264849_10848 [Melghirimyces algeriensis]